ncbi:hypothetical protein BDN72DRAFT_865263, partial [Pluteus cervinus]
SSLPVKLIISETPLRLNESVTKTKKLPAPRPILRNPTPATRTASSTLSNLPSSLPNTTPRGETHPPSESNLDHDDDLPFQRPPPRNPPRNPPRALPVLDTVEGSDHDQAGNEADDKHVPKNDVDDKEEPEDVMKKDEKNEDDEDDEEEEDVQKNGEYDQDEVRTDEEDEGDDRVSPKNMDLSSPKYAGPSDGYASQPDGDYDMEQEDDQYSISLAVSASQMSSTTIPELMATVDMDQFLTQPLNPVILEGFQRSKRERPEELSSSSQPRDDIHQFHLGEVPPTVEADDPVDQGAIYRSILRTPAAHLNPSARQEWARMPVQRVPLSALEKMYKHRLTDHAISLLHTRMDVVLDEDYVVDPQSPNLLWKLDGHFIDYILVVGKPSGLHAFLPRRIPPPSFQVTIQPQLRREFRARYGSLGFKPNASMLYLGSGPGGEFWLGMCPIEDLERTSSESDKLGDGKWSSSCLSAKHGRMLEMFIIYALSRLNDLDVKLRVEDRYVPPVLAEIALDLYQHRSASKPRQTYPLHVNYDQLRRLHKIFKTEWDPWVQEAPDFWLQDGWLLQHVPISISYRYGQNQRIFESPDTIHDEAANWRNEYDFMNIRFMSLALASHLKCYVVEDWEERSADELLEEEDHFYTHPNPDLREEIPDIRTYPALDPNTGRENRIYRDNGRYIPRFAALYDPATTNPCGLLVNLDTIPPLFRERQSSSDKPAVSVYPQAFTRVYGHVQANSVFSPLETMVSTVNSVMGKRVSQSSDSGEEDDAMNVDVETLPVVDPISSQLYNHLMHRTRKSAKYHDVQRGVITSALSGAYYLDAAGQAKHRQRVRACTSSLPHQTFDEQISSNLVDGVPRSLRMENVWTFMLDHLEDDQRFGDIIFKEIICYLVQAWSHPIVIDELKKHLIVLTPEVNSHLYQQQSPPFQLLSHAFPSIYKWMTFPITSLLERVWKGYRASAPGHRPAPEVVELTAVLERTLAYAHTGNAKVLSTRLMAPLWILTSLLEQGLPVLDPNHVRFHFGGEYPLSYPLNRWPLLPGYQPVSASRRVQELTYGNLHFQTYNAHLRIAIVDTSPPPIMTDIRNNELRRSAVIAYIGLTTFVQDVQKLVATGVSAQVKELYSTGDIPSKAIAEHMESSLKIWSRATFPLSYADDGYEMLLHAILPNKEDHRNGLPTPKAEGLGIYAFARSIVDMCQSENRRPISAPLISTGSSHSVLSVAVGLMEQLAALQTAYSPTDFIVKAITLAADELQINFIPWTPPLSGSSGARARKPVYNSWMTLGLPETTAPKPTIALVPSAVARQAATQADCRASWSIASLTLQQLPLYINREIRPEEWDIKHAHIKDDGSITALTYQHIIPHLDLTNHLHRLALLTSIFFAKSLPDIYHDKEHLSAIPKGIPLAEYREEVRNLPWTAKNKKGSTQIAPFIVLFTTFVINLYDSQSPALKDFEKNQKWDPAWLEKHTSKGINAIQLIRLGLAHPRRRITAQAKLHRPGRPGDWVLLTEDEIEERYKSIMSTLQKGQYGPYHAAVMIVGEQKAKQLAMVLEQVKIDKSEQATSNSTVDGSSQIGPKRHWTTVEEPNSNQMQVYIRDCSLHFLDISLSLMQQTPYSNSYGYICNWAIALFRENEIRFQT